MPCDSSYLEPNEIEINAGRVKLLINEVLYKQPLNAKHYNSAYAYGVSKDELDALVRTLCDAMRDENPKNYSLELQVWWRDHQKADNIRKKKDEETYQLYQSVKNKLDKKELDFILSGKFKLIHGLL